MRGGMVYVNIAKLSEVSFGVYIRGSRLSGVSGVRPRVGCPGRKGRWRMKRRLSMHTGMF